MKKWKGLCILLGQTLLLTVVTLLCVIPFSCRVTEEGIVFVGGDYVSPVLEDVCVLDEKTVAITFSEKVKPRSFVVSEHIKDISDSNEHSQTAELSPALKAASGGYGRVDSECSLSEDGCTIICSACDRYEVGKAYEIFGTVEDKAGNSLTYCVPFSGYNSRVPKLIMTELQIKYAKGSDKGKTVFRGEFVELLALSDGNLAGLELEGGADGEAKKYVFPAVEVTQGEVILVHLRTVGEGCVNELDENLNAATAPHSAKGIRDLWSENTGARFNDDSDVIILRDSVSNTVLDAYMYAAEDAVEWKKGPAALSRVAAETGIYETGSINEAVTNYKTTPLRSFTRLDSADILAAAVNDPAFEYPVKAVADNWLIKEASPGTL